MILNIGVIFVLRGNKKMKLTYWIGAVARYKSHRKCLGTHKVQVPKEEDLDRQAVISIDSNLYGGLCLKIML